MGGAVGGAVGGLVGGGLEQTAGIEKLTAPEVAPDVPAELTAESHHL